MKATVWGPLIVVGILLALAILLSVENHAMAPSIPDTAATSTTATTTSGGSILPYQSGVAGLVLLAPTCPIERTPADPACAAKPYQTMVTVRRAGSGTIFAQSQTAPNGSFKFSLPPGDYEIAAQGGQVLPRCASVEAIVGPSGYTAANISCDTGIR